MQEIQEYLLCCSCLVMLVSFTIHFNVFEEFQSLPYKVCFKYDAIVSYLDNVNCYLSCQKNILALSSMGFLGVLSLVFNKLCFFCPLISPLSPPICQPYCMKPFFVILEIIRKLGYHYNIVSKNDMCLQCSLN